VGAEEPHRKLKMIIFSKSTYLIVAQRGDFVKGRRLCEQTFFYRERSLKVKSLHI